MTTNTRMLSSSMLFRLTIKLCTQGTSWSTNQCMQDITSHAQQLQALSEHCSVLESCHSWAVRVSPSPNSKAITTGTAMQSSSMLSCDGV